MDSAAVETAGDGQDAVEVVVLLNIYASIGVLKQRKCFYELLCPSLCLHAIRVADGEELKPKTMRF